MTIYGKPYTSIGGLRCRRHFHISFGKRLAKDYGKPWGYWNMYYDGFFHFFGLGPFVLIWYVRAQPIELSKAKGNANLSK